MNKRVCEECHGLGKIWAMDGCGPLVRCSACKGLGVVDDPTGTPLGVIMTDSQWATEKPWSHYPMGRAA